MAFYALRRLARGSAQSSKSLISLENSMQMVNQHVANIRNARTTALPLRVRKDLLKPDEKAHIIATMKTGPLRTVNAWAWEFRRLPATILKFAAEAGIRVLP